MTTLAMAATLGLAAAACANTVVTSQGDATTSGATTSSSTSASSSSSSSGAPSCTMGGTGSPFAVCPMGYCSIGMGGYAFTDADSQQAQAPASATSTATWHQNDMLCIDGEVEQLPPYPTMDSSKNWGCGLGVNLDQALGPMTPALPYTFSGTGITVSTNGVPCCVHNSRVLVEDNGMEYCAALTDGVEIPWAMFNTACWAPNTGMALTGPPTSPSIRVRLTPSNAPACPFTNFCITAIQL
jgi:hypothetical protein